MDLYELCDAVGGEIVRSKVRVREGSKYVVFGDLTGGPHAFTPAGVARVAELTGEVPVVEDVVEEDEVIVNPPQAAAESPQSEALRAFADEPSVGLTDGTDDSVSVGEADVDFE